MVLENLSSVNDEANSASFTSDSSRPAADSDPWSSSAYDGQTSQNKIIIDKSNLPRPLPIISPLLGYTQLSLDKSISTTIEGLSRIIQRPLTQQECQAVAYHAAKGISISSYGAPIGVLAGVWRANKTRESYRFPLFKPNLKTFDPYKLGPLRGPTAELGWFLLRTFAYGATGAIVGRTLVGGYAASVVMTGMRMDTRLKDAVELMREQSRSEKSKPSGHDNPPTAAVPQQQQDVTFRAGERAYANAKVRQDLDASPTAYGWSEDSSSTEINHGNTARRNTGREQEEQQQLWQSQSKVQQSRQHQKEQTKQSSQMTGTGGIDFGNYDDASPTAVSSTAQESAWERVRRNHGASGISAQNASQQQTQRSKSEYRRQGEGLDSWTRGKGWENQQGQSKEEAQREFDARVERERRGENF